MEMLRGSNFNNVVPDSRCHERNGLKFQEDFQFRKNWEFVLTKENDARAWIFLVDGSDIYLQSFTGKCPVYSLDAARKSKFLWCINHGGYHWIVPFGLLSFYVMDRFTSGAAFHSSPNNINRFTRSPELTSTTSSQNYRANLSPLGTVLSTEPKINNLTIPYLSYCGP